MVSPSRRLLCGSSLVCSDRRTELFLLRRGDRLAMQEGVEIAPGLGPKDPSPFRPYSAEQKLKKRKRLKQEQEVKENLEKCPRTQ